MNTKYELGNVIKDSTSFTSFAFPAELPTEEWKGNEARSYTNYARPVANLFENDRENESLSKDLYASVISDITKNVIINGCKVVKTAISGHNYYEVQHGAFTNSSRIYYIYPACEAVAKQIEREYELAGNASTLKIKITYDYNSNSYSCFYILNDVISNTITSSTAVNLVSTLLTTFSLSNTIESHVILPILKDTDTTTIYFNGSSIISGTPTGNGNTIIATTNSGTITQSTVLSTLNGGRIENSTVTNNKLYRDYIIVGNTYVHLGDTQTNYTGINSINGVQQKIEDGAIALYYRVGDTAATTLKVPSGVNYTLGNACTKTFDTATTLATDANVPTNSAVKGYITSLLSNATFTGNAKFNAGITIQNASALSTNGKINVTNNSDASGTSSALSGNASITTKGGIEADGSIFAKGNIIGLNSGTYSKRSLKENITDFTESAVDLINDVHIVNYNYKADANKNHKIGFIADDTHEYFSTINHNIMDESNCIGLLLKAVQELSAEVKVLSEQNESLKEKLDELKSNKSKSRK